MKRRFESFPIRCFPLVPCLARTGRACTGGPLSPCATGSSPAHPALPSPAPAKDHTQTRGLAEACGKSTRTALAMLRAVGEPGGRPRKRTAMAWAHAVLVGRATSGLSCWFLGRGAPQGPAGGQRGGGYVILCGRVHYSHSGGKVQDGKRPNHPPQKKLPGNNYLLCCRGNLTK